MVTASPPIIVDQYAPLAHKEIIGVYGDASQTSTYTPSWVRPGDRRRLAAYLVRAAYLGNVARLLLPSAEDADTYREYGDAATLVRRLVASVLGEGWALTVDGADDDLLAGPTLPERPEDPGTDDAIAQRIYAGRLAACLSKSHAGQANSQPSGVRVMLMRPPRWSRRSWRAGSRGRRTAAPRRLRCAGRR